MTALTTEEFTTWANRLANLPWPMTLEEFTTTATKDFGWTTTRRKTTIRRHLFELFRTDLSRKKQ